MADFGEEGESIWGKKVKRFGGSLSRDSGGIRLSGIRAAERGSEPSKMAEIGVIKEAEIRRGISDDLATIMNAERILVLTTARRLFQMLDVENGSSYFDA